MKKKLNNNLEYDLPLSKTRLKQDMHALQDIGEQLVTFNLKQLSELNLSEILIDAIIEAKKIHKHEARRRQMQFIGKLMREVDVAPIQQKSSIWGGISSQHNAWSNLLEHWRDRLLTDEHAIAEFGREYPAADLQLLRTLMRNTHKEKIANKAPKSFRVLFRELKIIIPKTLRVGVTTK